MSKTAKFPFKTPLAEIRWVNITGQGKLKFDPEGKLDKDATSSYQYTATAVLTKEQAEPVIAKLKAFWKDNKPAGATKMQYDTIKPEMKDVLDKDGNPQEDDEGAPIQEATGLYLLGAKTITHWPDGKPNKIKVLRGNGQPLNLGEKEIGDGSIGVIHGTMGINTYKGNEGINFYLTAVQLKKFVEKMGGDVDADDLGEDEGLDELEMDGVDQPINIPKV